MPEFNEENYLDSLLKEVDSNKSDFANNREKYMQKLADTEQEEKPVSEEELEAQRIKQQVEEADEKISTNGQKTKHSPLDLFRRTGKNDTDDHGNENQENDVHSKKEIHPTRNQSDASQSTEKISESSRETYESHDSYEPNESHESHESEHHMNQSENDMKLAHLGDPGDNVLTESEMSRLANMNLDDIIDHVNSGSLDDHDIFNDHSNQSDEPVDGIPDELLAAAKEQADQKDKKNKKNKKEKVRKNKLKSKDKNNNQINNGEQPKANHKSGKKFMGALKDIFFESLDDENADHNVQPDKISPEGDESILDESNDNTENHAMNQATDTDETVSLADVLGTDVASGAASVDDISEKANSQSDRSASNSSVDGKDTDGETEIDENEALLKEMYGTTGDEGHLEEDLAPQKGFFAKLKYRWSERKKKNQEAEKAEQEAEALVEAEKSQKKEEKKAAKETKKAEKKAKPKKEKAPKVKKEKKPKKVKEPPKPGDILKIRPKSIVCFVLFISGIIVLIITLNYSLNYTTSINEAKLYMQNSNYEKAYQELSGMELKEKDQDLYREAAVVMYVQGQYISYQNNLKNNQNARALDSLIKGLENYNSYYNEASNLGVRSEYDTIRGQIIEALNQSFNLSEAEASALMIMSENDFTQYYNKIQTYER